LADQLPWDKEIQKGIIGIAPIYNKRNASIGESFANGFKQTFHWLDMTCKSLISLITGNVSMKEMAGPIMIAKMAGETASEGGMFALLGLMAIISVNLGLINILPIPGLDGGHVLIALIEGTIRRELPLKIKLGIQQVGLLLLLILFFTIMFNDIQRLM
jgi:regulator of sigma E protease